MSEKPTETVRILRLAAWVNRRTVRQLSAETGIDQIRLGRLLRGERKLRDDELAILSRALEVDFGRHE
jgi:hypothetical protein